MKLYLVACAKALLVVLTGIGATFLASSVPGEKMAGVVGFLVVFLIIQMVRDNTK